MTLIDKMKLRSFEKALAINHHKALKDLGLCFESVKSIVVLTEKDIVDENLKQFISLLEKQAIVHVITYESQKGEKDVGDNYSFCSSEVSWGHLPPDNILSKWQSFKTDLVINYFDESCKPLIYLSAILDQSHSVGVFENKWLSNDVTIRLKEKSSKEFSNMFFYLMETTIQTV